jgi:hypothetical protein
MIPPLADYATSRHRLLSVAESLGASIDEHRHPGSGPAGEVLYTDVARFGAPIGSADTVVVIGSGLHGVEGHAGWGLQMLLLESGRLDTLPPGVAVVLVHAINPYGMAWSRRVDHENIDVNRNFVEFEDGRPANPHYAAIDPILNPDTPELDLDDAAWVDALWAFAAEVGATEAFRAISGGQYDVPRGVQFGGQAPSWSRRTLQAIWDRHLAGARTMFNLDLHTGLGPCGGLTIFQTADEGDPSADVAARWFPRVLRFDRPGSVDPLQAGVLGPGLEAAMPDGLLAVPIVVEFGTQPDAVVLTAMRADNWLHAHGTPRSELGERIRERTRDAFFIDDEGWRTSVAEDGLATIHAALDAAGQHPSA